MCSGPSFEDAFKRRRVNLNDGKSVARFGTISANPDWGKFVQDVSFTFTTCPLANAENRLQSPKNAETLFNELVGCFEALGKIERLHLRGESGGCDHDEWEHPKHTKDETSAAYLIVFSAAIEARLNVQQVELLDIPPALKPHTILAPLKLRHESNSIKALESLSISIDCFEYGERDSLPDSFSGILRSRTSNGDAADHLRSLCSGVKKLILDLGGMVDSTVALEALLHRIAINGHFPVLQEFGIYADFLDSRTLLTFLRKSSGVTDLSLGRLIYTKREWGEVFLQIERKMPCLTGLVLDQVQIRDQDDDIFFMWASEDGEGERRVFRQSEILNSSFRSAVQ